MSQKSQQNQTYDNRNTTSWGQIVPQDTPDIQRLRGQQFQVDPTIAANFGDAKNRLEETYGSPQGGYASQPMREKMVRSGTRQLAQDAAVATRAGEYDVNRLNYGRNLAVAGMTRPEIVQTGSTGSGTGQVTQRGSPWQTIGQVAGAAASVGSASL